ncbi:hypothetical protein ACE0DR_08585 [Azotobacter sp. CWF10]
MKYVLGSHDDVGDLENGNAEDGATNWDKSHRYFIDQLGGREDRLARAKCRLGWALNIAMPGTPMLFMGTECHMASPMSAGVTGTMAWICVEITASTGESPAIRSACRCAGWSQPAMRYAGRIRRSGPTPVG